MTMRQRTTASRPSGEGGDMGSEIEMSAKERRDCAYIAGSMAMVGVRHAALVYIHAGRLGVSKTGDNSDVLAVNVEGGRRPWTEVSHYDNAEMRNLMSKIVEPVSGNWRGPRLSGWYRAVNPAYGGLGWTEAGCEHDEGNQAEPGPHRARCERKVGGILMAGNGRHQAAIAERLGSRSSGRNSDLVWGAGARVSGRTKSQWRRAERNVALLKSLSTRSSVSERVRKIERK